MTPLRKPSERLKRRLDETAFNSEESPSELFRKRFFRWINTRLGWRVAAALVAVFTLWVQWDKVQKLPGVETVLNKLAELRGIPRAQGDRFSILVAKLDNDKDGTHRRLIDDALRGQFNSEIEVLLPDRTISIAGADKPQDAVSAGHEQARALLREANANVMLWGEALDAKTEAPMRLHWTVNAEAKLKKSSEKYHLVERNYDLPELFWNDLSDVLRSLATSQAAALSGQAGSFLADKLDPFINRLRLLVDSPRLADQHRASIRLVLADVLLIYFEQRGDNNALHEAVAKYREVLKEYTHEQVPLEWARVQNHLGNALWMLGDREHGTARLDEAVAAYRESLKVFTRERVPSSWAKVQNGLGDALCSLGEREGGTVRLQEAVTAFQEALEVRTREQLPLEWALTQNSLGTALQALGARESGTVRLEQSVSTYREALKELTRERVPLDWARTQSNLGIALRVLGERESEAARLEEAVSAYREALKEQTLERVPLEWAKTQNNLGRALYALAKRESGTARLVEAVAAYKGALREFKRAEFQSGITLTNLVQAEFLLASRSNRSPNLSFLKEYVNP